MSMQDPISDMLTVIRNGQISKKEKICVVLSKIKLEIVHVLIEEGFLKNCNIINGTKPKLEIFLKYYQKGNPVIDKIQRISRPGLRVYSKKKFLPTVMSGMGIVILTTSRGIMTDKKARYNNIGGEILCTIS